MRRSLLHGRVLTILCVALSFIRTTPLIAQGSDLSHNNNDIVKMIQAGLPESVVVEKIRQGASHWDTSIEALISLKTAGATQAELSALTSAPLLSFTPSPSSPTLNKEQMVEVLGARLLRTQSRDPYLLFESSLPETFPNGLESNTASLVIYKDEIAVLVPAVLIGEGGMDGDCSVMNVLFQHDRIVLDIYMFGACSLSAGPTQSPLRNGLYEYQRGGLQVVHRDEVHHLKVPFDKISYVDGEKKTPKCDVVFGLYPYGFESGAARTMRAALLDPFIARLFTSFDDTIMQLDKVAGLYDPLRQLSTNAHYVPVSPALAAQYKAILEQRWHESHTGGGNGWISALNALQGVASIQQAMAQGKVADANHDVFGQLGSAVNAASATVGMVGDTSTAPVIGPSTTPNSIKEAIAYNQTTANGLSQPKINNAAVPTASLRKQTVTATSNPQPAGIQVASTGTAPPPTCVYLGPGNCVPINQYKQPQPQGGPVVKVLCPATGFVPGIVRHPAPDVAEGVPCVSGSPIYINGAPQFDTTGTGLTSTSTLTSESVGTVMPVGTTVANPAQCHDMAFVVQLDASWTNPKKTEVVGYFTNNTISEVTCTWAFHKSGQWTEYGQGYIHAGVVRQGGEQGGVWTVGADSSSMKYACFEGKDPVDVSGRSCNANLVFTGQTMAGTDK